MEESVISRKKGDKIFQTDSESFDKSTIVMVASIGILFAFSAYMYKEYRKIKSDMTTLTEDVSEIKKIVQSSDLLEKVNYNTATVSEMKATLDKLLMIYQQTYQQAQAQQAQQVQQTKQVVPKTKKQEKQEVLFEDAEEYSEYSESDQEPIKPAPVQKKSKKIIVE